MNYENINSLTSGMVFVEDAVDGILPQNPGFNPGP
jgi:hypothetical protein